MEQLFSLFCVAVDAFFVAWGLFFFLSPLSNCHPSLTCSKCLMGFFGWHFDTFALMIGMHRITLLLDWFGI